MFFDQMPTLDYITVGRRISTRHIRYTVGEKTDSVVVQTRLVSHIWHFNEAVLNARGHRPRIGHVITSGHHGCSNLVDQIGVY